MSITFNDDFEIDLEDFNTGGNDAGNGGDGEVDDEIDQEVDINFEPEQNVDVEQDEPENDAEDAELENEDAESESETSGSGTNGGSNAVQDNELTQSNENEVGDTSQTNVLVLDVEQGVIAGNGGDGGDDNTAEGGDVQVSPVFVDNEDGFILSDLEIGDIEIEL
jgi:hypothetical protein